MRVLLLPVAAWPRSKSRDKLIARREESLDGWYWNEDTNQYEPSNLENTAYDVTNITKGKHYIVHLWRSPSSGKFLAACECPASGLCKHILFVARQVLQETR